MIGPTDTGFLDAPLAGDALRELAFDETSIDKFTRDGFVGTSEPVLNESQLEQLRADLDALCEQTPPHPDVDLLHELHYNEAAGTDQVLFHCLGHWRLACSFHDVLWLDSVALKASQCLQGRSESGAMPGTGWGVPASPRQ